MDETARTFRRNLARFPPYICCSLRADALKKAVEDVQRILHDAKPRQLLICSSQPVSEDMEIKIEAAVREIAREVETVRVHGQERLTQLSMRYPRAMESLYRAELADLQEAHIAESSHSDVEHLTGLRIALTTQLHENAQQRRSDLLRNLALTALTQSDAEIGQVAHSISRALHLPRSVNSGLLAEELERLVTEQLIDRDGERFFITTQGRGELAKRSKAGSERLQIGKSDLQQEIESLTGHKIVSSEWNMIWNILQDGISKMFLAHGSVLIHEISSLLHTPSDRPKDQLLDHIESMALRVAALPGGGDRAATIAQAVRDLFSERTSKAVAWLGELCSVYIDMCSLRLETQSQEQIRAILQEYVLVRDTDIVLSLLSEAEPNHFHVLSILREWHSLGCQLGVVVPVLEEAAHHAWIADADYEPNWRQLGDMTAQDAQRLLENVFVREFRQVAAGRYERSQWNSYIAAFRGSFDHDYDKIADLLFDHGIAVIPDGYSDPEDAKAYAKRLEDHLYKLRHKPNMEHNRSVDVREKCNRDARLATFLASYRITLSAEGRSASVVSTSNALRTAIEACSDITRDPEPILHLGAVAWLLSLVPGVKLTLAALRGVLFDAAVRKHLPTLERHLLRIVHASEEYSLHWSRRSTLYRSVRDKLGKIANQRGQPLQEVERLAVSGTEEGKGIFIESVSEALDETSRSRSEDELQRLRLRVAELERQLGSRSGR